LKLISCMARIAAYSTKHEQAVLSIRLSLLGISKWRDALEALICRCTAGACRRGLRIA
jgi:hypothetical protein